MFLLNFPPLNALAHPSEFYVFTLISLGPLSITLLSSAGQLLPVCVSYILFAVSSRSLSYSETSDVPFPRPFATFHYADLVYIPCLR